MSEHEDRGVGQLVDAGVPADQGLATLGLLMQLAGNLFAPLAALLVLQQLLVHDYERPKLWTFLVLGLSIVRSLLHRAAGTQLLYGNGASENPSTDRFAGIMRYVTFSAAHSLAIGGLLSQLLGAPACFAFGVTAALAIWPVTLFVLTRLPRFARFRHQLPMSEDKGFESTAVVMTVFGLCGVLAVGGVLFVLLDAAPLFGPGLLFVLAPAVLLVRSIFQVHAGLAGLRQTNVDHVVELANRYASFGVISSFCTIAAMMLFVVYGAANVFALAAIACVCWMLMAWPLAVRRFYSERQFADLLAGDRAPLHRRAPDAGLTGLGWLLFAHAMLTAAFVVIAMTATSGLGPLAGTMALGALGFHSLWFPAGVAVLQAWAGFELIRMSPQSRAIATAFGIVGLAVTVYANLPVLRALDSLDWIDYSSLGPIAIALVLPVTTLLLVNRAITPTARARFRKAA